MTIAYGPTVGRRRLRTELRRAREAAGLTQEQVAQAMDWSLSKLIRIEAGYVSISTNDVKALLAHYRLHDSAQVERLVQLARIARQRTWWSAYRDSVPPAYYSYIGLEAEATRLCFYQSVGMPGLLQTEAYARAILTGIIPRPEDPAAARTSMELRLRRQREVFNRPNPPAVEVVLDEATLHRRVGGDEVIREQLHHLIQLVEANRVTIQVLPFTAAVYTPLGQFVIIGLADDSEVVYLESTGLEDVLDQPEVVASHARTFAALREAALTPTESLARITAIAGGLGGARPRTVPPGSATSCR